MSLRFRTSKQGLKEVPISSRRKTWGHVDADPERRKWAAIYQHQKFRKMREAEQSEKGLAEFPYELINQTTGEVMKKHFMSDTEAIKRNGTIRSLDMAWRRCGY